MEPTRAGDGEHRGPRRTARIDGRRDELADRITEQAVQLLFTARQDIAEVCEEVADDRALQRAQFRVLDAIEVLRRVATEVRSPGWDLSLPPRPTRADREAAFRTSVREHHEARRRWTGEREAREQARARRRERFSR